MEKKLKFWEFGINFFQWNLKDNKFDQEILIKFLFFICPRIVPYPLVIGH